MTLHTWLTFEDAHWDSGKPVSRQEALAAFMTQLHEAAAANPKIAGGTLIHEGERIVLDLASIGGRA